MDFFKKNSNIFLAIAALVVVFLVFQKTRVETQSASSPPLNNSTNKKERMIEAPATGKDANASVAQKVRNYNLLMMNGVTPIGAIKKAEDLEFTVIPRPDGQWCRPGDFDLLKSTIATLKDKSIVLSVESLEGPAYMKAESYSLLDIDENRAAKFSLPNATGAYGLYLCTGKKAASCASKPLLDQRAWNLPVDKAKLITQDKTFYFQLLIVKDGEVNLISSEKWGAENLRHMNSALGAWLGDLKDTLTTMNKTIGTLKPMPAEVINHSIFIPLPYNNLRCKTMKHP